MGTVVLIVTYHHGGTEVFGPFPTAKRANEYGATIDSKVSMTIQNLVVPYAVVQDILWRPTR